MNHLPDNFRWSFSKLAAYRQCKRSFYLQYIVANQEDQIESYYSQYGSFAHKLLEQYYKGDLPSFCLADAWREGYESDVTMPPPRFPVGLGDKYYAAAEEYFENFQDLDTDRYDVLSVERKFVIDLDGYQISGIADLVLRDNEDPDHHGIIVIDHKSKSMNSLKKERNLYRKQLYLYALWVKQEFGQWPTKLIFNMFKEHTEIVEEFSIDEMEATKKWFLDTIHEIETSDVFEDWDTNYSSYFCGQICSCAAECDEYHVQRAEEIERWKAKKQAEEEMMMYGTQT